jgi:hypothetical protein
MSRFLVAGIEAALRGHSGLADPAVDSLASGIQIPGGKAAPARPGRVVDGDALN